MVQIIFILGGIVLIPFFEAVVYWILPNIPMPQFPDIRIAKEYIYQSKSS